ncbi:hypothetical protein WOC76_06960 [Methylocystis sp. IM3]|uniref:hypothetical protein n=1 Tax=unclassified Methylocystis TaxID=2625913 RepID=UPI0030F6669E
MTDHPRFFAQELAADAERDFGALERRKAEVDTRLAKLSAADQQQFREELTRLLKRNQIAGAKPSFRRSWSNGK